MTPPSSVCVCVCSQMAYMEEEISFYDVLAASITRKRNSDTIICWKEGEAIPTNCFGLAKHTQSHTQQKHKGTLTHTK